MAGTKRPYRATIFLPGQGEGGALVSCATVSAATEAGLAKAVARWTSQGYEARAWEEIPLPLEGLDPCKDSPA